MENEWTYRLINGDYHLFWGEWDYAIFQPGIVIEEMESAVEKLNEGSPFEGFCRFIDTTSDSQSNEEPSSSSDVIIMQG